MGIRHSAGLRRIALGVVATCFLALLFLLPLCGGGDAPRADLVATQSAAQTLSFQPASSLTWTLTAGLPEAVVLRLLVEPGVMTVTGPGEMGLIALEVLLVLFAAIGVAAVAHAVISRKFSRAATRSTDPLPQLHPDAPAQNRQPNPEGDLLPYETLVRQGQELLTHAGPSDCHGLMLVELADADRLRTLDPTQWDRLCRRTARILQRLVCTTDLLSQVAPGQFALLLRDLPTVGVIPVKAADICDTLRLADREDPAPVQVSCHIGIALFCGGDEKDFGQLMREAEIALERCGEREYAYFAEPAGVEAVDEDALPGHSQDDRTLYGENRRLRNFLRELDGFLLVLQVEEEIRPLYVSAGFYAHASPEEARGISLEDEVGEEDLPMVSSLLRICVTQDRTQDLVYRTPSGSWHRAQAAKIRGEQEGEKLLLAVITDVSAQKRQELLERLRRQQLEALFRILQLSTFEVDLSSRTIAFSAEQGQRELFSQPDFPESLIALGLVMAVSQEELRLFAKKIFRGDPEGKADLWVWTGEGGGREQVHLTFHTVPDDHGQPVKGVGMSELTAQPRQSVPDSEAEYDQNAVLKMQLKMQEKYYLYAQKYQTELRKYRHDRRNTFIALSAMLESNDTQGIRRYVDKLGEEIQAAATVISTQNPALDALLSDKFAQAKSVGIQVKHMIGLKPNTGVDPIDFCVVMGCSLDNAIESCQRVMGAGENAFLSLHLVERRGAIVCKLQNSAIRQQENTDFHTTKWDTLNHGFGLKNVEAIVHKYGGLLSLRQEDELFVTEFTLFTE